MNTITNQYIDLCKDILDNGTFKEGRNGNTYSVFGRMIRTDLSLHGFPLLKCKDVWFKGVKHELLWFLSGETNIKPLVDNGVNIWVGDCYKRYLNTFSVSGYGIHTGECLQPYSEAEFIRELKNRHRDDEFVERFGSIGPGYGYQWRSFDGGIDQVADALNLLLTNPSSRRILVTAWNPIDVEDCVVPPCHTGFQLTTEPIPTGDRKRYDGREYYLNLSWNQRSVDVPLGLPFNIASYGLLLELFAHCSNMVPRYLVGFLGDTHIYENQVNTVRRMVDDYEKQDTSSRQYLMRPYVTLDVSIATLNCIHPDQIRLNDYFPFGQYMFPLSN